MPLHDFHYLLYLLRTLFFSIPISSIAVRPASLEMAHNRRDDDLAYGDYHPRDGDDDGAEGERGIFGGRVSKRLFGGGQQQQQQSVRIRKLL